MLAPGLSFFAHAEHWTTSVLYIVPVVAGAGAICWLKWHEYRRGRDVDALKDLRGGAD